MMRKCGARFWRDGCYIIDEGTIRLELQNPETDSDGVIGFLEAGMFLGEFSLIDGRPRSASVNYAQPEAKSSRNSKNETFQGPLSVSLRCLLLVYVYNSAG